MQTVYVKSGMSSEYWQRPLLPFKRALQMMPTLNYTATSRLVLSWFPAFLPRSNSMTVRSSGESKFSVVDNVGANAYLSLCDPATSWLTGPECHPPFDSRDGRQLTPVTFSSGTNGDGNGLMLGSQRNMAVRTRWQKDKKKLCRHFDK